MDDGERELYARSVGRAVTAAGGDDLDPLLTELDWYDAVELDVATAVPVWFEAQGAAAARSSALLHLMPGSVLPAAGSTDPPGTPAGLRGLTFGDELTTVATTIDGKTVLARFEGVEQRAVRGLDPDLGLVEVTASGAPHAEGPCDWAAGLRLGQLALAHELIGCGRAMLDLARAHALDRVQFGRPIAGFQAVRHRLTDAFVAIEAADALAASAWADPDGASAAMAKASAGHAAQLTARHAQQVLAGIGFTVEHGFHRYLRRSMVLDQLLGSARELTLGLGRACAESRTLPALQPL